MYIPDSSPQNITLFFTAIIGVSIVVLRELKPTTRLGYSKFASTNSTIWKIPSRWGMLLIYMPSALLFLALLTLPSAKGHVWITVLLSAFHYMKRIYEVLFLHKYSGSALIKDTLLISTCYAVHAVGLVYLTARVPVDRIVRKQVTFGTTFFIVGETMNHYHHRILAGLRKEKDDLGEIIAFIAMGFVSQNGMTFVLQLGSAAYLAVRAHNTKAWYESKFPQAAPRAALMPGIL
ncbi:predicted protein [Lichtheimia corymbifera JMRC:FSU:9682]|uniref:Steroid 5-alpha reductase C-terminal domain-containing protein n=1 Tax=Lichtheimia corymbifera JMRC:FSU:9682 TaxID=1263082 RepID=A0A068RKL2_9FUNG|nr:predicted protein [Lichtheimia corymbifera JMRC:FSU:9682]